jgi:ABC-type polysaccharide/polyol phosphate export permease
VLALPVVVGVEILLLLGPAYVVATLNVRFRDTRHLVTVALGVVFYLTPVIYDPGRVPDRFRWVIDANPLAIPVRLHHDVLYRGRWPDVGLLALGTAIGVAGALVAGTVVGRARAHLADDL